MRRRIQKSHHLPPSLTELSDQLIELQRAEAKKEEPSKKTAQLMFLSLVKDQSIEIKKLSMRFEDLPEGQLPALFFTIKGSNPVVILDRIGNDFQIRLWDGRESICNLRHLKKTLSKGGYVTVDPTEEVEVSSLRDRAKAWKKFIADEKPHLILGIAAGAVTCSVLILFISAMYHAYESTFYGAEIGSPGLIVVGMISAVLCSFAFIQVRIYISLYFESLSHRHRSQGQTLPSPYPMRAALNTVTIRQWFEIATIPLLLLGATALVSWDPISVAAWAGFIGCAVAAIVFAAGLPELISSASEANWFLGKKLPAKNQSVIFNRQGIPALRTHNLYLAHPDEGEKPLIDSLSIEIEPGEKIGFLGKRKADTAILLKVLSGELSADRGMIWLNGETLTAKEPNPKIGSFCDRAKLIKGSLHENILHGLDGGKVGLDQISRAAAMSGLNTSEIFKSEGTDFQINDSGFQLSSIERIQVLLTRTFLNRPEILVVESPIDPDFDQVLRGALDNYLRAYPDTTLLLGGKRGSQLSSLVDRSVLISQGRILLDGNTSFVLTSYQREMTKVKSFSS